MLLLLWAHLVTSSLILSHLSTAFKVPMSSDYDKFKIRLRSTIVSLEGDKVTVQGINRQQYLLCFREGQMIFPNLEVDQTAGLPLTFKVHENDKFVWLWFIYLPADPFVSLVYPPDGGNRMTEAEVEEEIRKSSGHFSFQVSYEHKVTMLSKVKSCTVPWINFIFKFFLIIMVLSALTGAIVFLATPKDPCHDPTNREFIYQAFALRREVAEICDFNLELEKNCNDQSFNATYYHDRIQVCLGQLCPFADPSSWNPIKFQGNPIYFGPNGRRFGALECSLNTSKQ